MEPLFGKSRMFSGSKSPHFNCINTAGTLVNTGAEEVSSLLHTRYLSFFLHRPNFWRIKFTPKKRVNYDKIHSKLPIFCVITAKYTVNCQIFALNLKKFTPAKKIYTSAARGARDKYQVWKGLRNEDDLERHEDDPHVRLMVVPMVQDLDGK